MKHGAILSLPVISRREDTVSQDDFRNWITSHIDSWFTFTQELGLGIEMEDIVLVTGFHRTRSWSHLVYNEVKTDTQFSLEVEVARAGASVNWQELGFHGGIQGAVLNRGPNGEVRRTLHTNCKNQRILKIVDVLP